MTDYAFRPRVLWMQGTEVRQATHAELFAMEEIPAFGEALADTIAENGAVSFETQRGDWHSIPARLITDVHYQRVEVAPAQQRETLPTRTRGGSFGHCCTEGSPCRDGDATAGAAPLPPDDPDKCAETLATMDTAGAVTPPDNTNDAAASCPCWPGACTCGDADALMDREVAGDGA
jgi:hypothetical protein